MKIFFITLTAIIIIFNLLIVFCCLFVGGHMSASEERIKKLLRQNSVKESSANKN